MADELLTLVPEDICAEAEKLAKPFQVLCTSVMTAFYVRHLATADRATLAEQLKSDTTRKRRDLVISACLSNADGTQRFTPEVFALVRKMDNRDAERFYKTACRVNGIPYIPTKAK